MGFKKCNYYYHVSIPLATVPNCHRAAHKVAELADATRGTRHLLSPGAHNYDAAHRAGPAAVRELAGCAELRALLLDATTALARRRRLRCAAHCERFWRRTTSEHRAGYASHRQVQRAGQTQR